jgi:hypothetical protein
MAGRDFDGLVAHTLCCKTLQFWMNGAPRVRQSSSSVLTAERRRPASVCTDQEPGRSGSHRRCRASEADRPAAPVYLTHFNAGLRIYDVGTATAPREVGYFLPPDPRRRYGTFPKGKLVAQSEDVLVDTRGFIYVTHKNQGLWILKYTTK